MNLLTLYTATFMMFAVQATWGHFRISKCEVFASNANRVRVVDGDRLPVKIDSDEMLGAQFTIYVSTNNVFVAPSDSKKIKMVLSVFVDDDGYPNIFSEQRERVGKKNQNKEEKTGFEEKSNGDPLYEPVGAAIPVQRVIAWIDRAIILIEKRGGDLRFYWLEPLTYGMDTNIYTKGNICDVKITEKQSSLLSKALFEIEPRANQ